MTKPVLHGRDHCPGGADPIPCLLSPGAVGDYEAIVTGIGDLVGYWRLGEASSPFADTSGYDPGDPADLNRVVTGVAMTPDVTGALPDAYDDGAVTFNYAADYSVGTFADYLLDTASSGSRFNFGAVAEEMSVAAWVKPQASGHTWDGAVIAHMSNVVGSPSYEAGWVLKLKWPAREAIFWRGGAGPSAQQASAGALPADEWTHLAATYDATDIRIYVNGGLINTVASAVNLPSVSAGAMLGWYTPYVPPGSSAIYTGYFYGSLDEVAVWGKTLTAAEVASLAGAGSNSGGAGAEFEVVESDGAGGVRWASPTIEVSF